jgi:two-component system KDP operon response regulator KdpE
MNDTTKGNVLLLDDDKFLVDMYSMKFVREGYTVQACLKAEDALAMLEGGFQADAIVFDILMPEFDGFAFLQKMQEKHLAPDAIRIALSNQNNDADKTRALSLGADRYIVKASMIPSEVVTTVAEELTKKKAKA